ncbi:hypothetical protein [Synechococcus sp. UW140]|uniref:hypothetical protein n=1 Tax=Synechococcus sp. UW140 TaxID=368503 RepID=UPI003138425B
MNFLQQLFFSLKFRINRFFHEKLLFKFLSKEKLFTSIYLNNYWGSSESLSGPGSSLDSTVEIRTNLPILFDKFNIKSVFDAPCGDMNWMRYISYKHPLKYIGGDIVREIVNTNASKFSSINISFVLFDITTNNFPAADVWLCRHCLFHLSNLDIFHALEQFASSDIKYILTTSHVTDADHVNRDIVTGDWRLLNLRMPPFNFPINAEWEVLDYIDPHPAATLTLWKREQILELMPALRLIYQQ